MPDDDDGPNPNVLGVSLGGTGVIAMFTDVIRSTNVLGLPRRRGRADRR